MSVPPIMEPWELSAREHCRNAIARYTHAGDRFQMEPYAGVFTVDGVLEMRGEVPVEGRQAIFDFFTKRPLDSGGGARLVIVRHNVTNVLFEEVTPELVVVGSYFTVFTDVGLDHMGRYRDRMVPDGDTWRIKHRFVSTDWLAPESRFAKRLRDGEG